MEALTPRPSMVARYRWLAVRAPPPGQRRSGGHVHQAGGGVRNAGSRAAAQEEFTRRVAGDDLPSGKVDYLIGAPPEGWTELPPPEDASLSSTSLT